MIKVSYTLPIWPPPWVHCLRQQLYSQLLLVRLSRTSRRHQHACVLNINAFPSRLRRHWTSLQVQREQPWHHITEQFSSERLLHVLWTGKDILIASPLHICLFVFLVLLGQISAQRVAWQVQRNGKNASQSVPAFIEELVVRRELTDNFCFYNKKYDSVEGQWRPH